jgi:allene oxide cyclase
VHPHFCRRVYLARTNRAAHTGKEARYSLFKEVVKNNEKGQKMKKSLISGAALTLVALALVGVMFIMNSGVFAVHANTNGTVIHVVEHAITDTVGDVPPKGDSLGDQLAFHNPVFDAVDKKQVGHDNGNCVRTVTGKNGVWECFWTVFLAAGQITVEGPYYTNGTDSLLAITGGTGAYNQVRGQMRLHARNAQGTEYDFIYEIAS